MSRDFHALPGVGGEAGEKDTAYPRWLADEGVEARGDLGEELCYHFFLPVFLWSGRARLEGLESV